MKIRKMKKQNEPEFKKNKQDEKMKKIEPAKLEKNEFGAANNNHRGRHILICRKIESP